MNKGLEILDKLRENLIFIFSLSIVASYCGSFGYFLEYNIDITSFLNLTDLTMIFAKWIWFSIFLIVMTFLILFNFFDEKSYNHNWLNKTIGKSNFKWRALVIMIFIIIFITTIISLLFVDDHLKNRIKLILFYSFIVFLIFIFIYIPKISLKNKTSMSQLTIKDFVGLGFPFVFFIYLLPILIGFNYAKFTKDSIKDSNVKIIFEDSSITDTVKNNNRVLIGKTSDYIFLYDKKAQKSIVYKADKIKAIEYYNQSK